MSEHIPPLPTPPPGMPEWLWGLIAVPIASAWAGLNLGRRRRRKDSDPDDEDGTRALALAAAREVVALHSERDRESRDALLDAWREVGRELGEKLDHIANRVDVANDRTRERVSGLLTAQQAQIQRVESGIDVLLDRSPRGPR